MIKLDHLVLCADRLENGVAFVENALKVPMSGGGKHAAFGTHNRLLSLGDIYLEVISIDPTAQKPNHPRWFGLDQFSGAPRLTNWVCRTEKPRRVIGKTIPGSGELMTVSRDDLKWQITVPKTGQMPLDGYAPAIIDWMDSPHPCTRLPDQGCRLLELTIGHPQAITLRSFLSGLLSDDRITIRGAEVPSCTAILSTPTGHVTLTS